MYRLTRRLHRGDNRGVLVRLVLTGCLAACVRPAVAHKVPSPPDTAVVVIDSTTPFLTWATSASRAGSADPVETYRHEVAASYPGFDRYVRTVMAARGAPYERAVRHALDQWNDGENELRALRDRIPGEVQRATGLLRGTFPDFDPKMEVRQLHSLGFFDGATRVIDGQYTLLFGVDVIAKYHRGQDLGPFFVHELFHTYTAQRHGLDGRSSRLVESAIEETQERQEPLYEALWDEGLATYVSLWLVPGASAAAAMLDVPNGLVARCVEHRATLARRLRGVLSTRDPGTYATWFYPGPKDPEIPGRAAYYFGFEVARRLHAKQQMEALLGLHGEALRLVIDAELVGLSAAGP